MAPLMIAAIAAPVISGAMGHFLGAGDRAAAAAKSAEAVQGLIDVGLPPDLSKRLVLEEFQKAGMLDPETEKTINMNVSKVAGIQEDSKLKDAQMSSLELLSQRANTGLNPEDMAALNKIRDQLARDQNAKQQQIVQNYQMRGMGGSGAELAAALSAEQSGANQASQQGDQLAAMASQNALQAAMQSGQLGGSIRSQDFDVSKTKAGAEDEMNRFNIQNQLGQQQRNVAAKNQAQQFNLQNEQNLMNANTQQANTETQRQNQAKRDFYTDKMNRASALGNALNGQANQLNNQASATGQMWSGVGSGIATGIAGYGKYQNDQALNESNISKNAAEANYYNRLNTPPANNPLLIKKQG